MSKIKIYPVWIQLEWDVMYVCKRGGGGGKNLSEGWLKFHKFNSLFSEVNRQQDFSNLPTTQLQTAWTFEKPTFNKSVLFFVEELTRDSLTLMSV